MSGVGEGGRGRSKSEYNPKAYKDRMTTIKELEELKFNDKGEPVDATERQVAVNRRGLNLPRAKSIRPSDMSQQLKDIEDAEKAAAKETAKEKEAKEAPKPLLYGANSTFDVLKEERKKLEKYGVKLPKPDASNKDTDKKKSLHKRNPSI